MTSAPSSRRLLDAAITAGLDPDEVRRILWAIVAPTTLDDVPEVLGKLGRVLFAADRQWPGIRSALKMATWFETLAKLQPIAKVLGCPITPDDARHLGKRGGNTGHRQRYALYSALLALPNGGSAYDDQCDLLMAHAFLAHFQILNIPAGTIFRGGLVKGDTSITAYEAYTGSKPWPALTISPKNCCLALRGFFCGEPWARAVVAAYRADIPPLQFANYAGLVFDGALLKHGKSNDWLEKQQEYLLFYLAQAYGIKPRHHGHGQKPGQTGTKSGASTEDDAKASDAFRHDDCPYEDEDDDADDNGAADSDKSGSTAQAGRFGSSTVPARKARSGADENAREREMGRVQKAIRRFARANSFRSIV